MSVITASTRSAVHITGQVAPFVADRPQYQHVEDGRFVPANEAARLECERWNQYADMINARTASRGTVQ